jgi:hypothetical protein
MDHFVVRDGKVVSNFVVFDQMQYGAPTRDDAAPRLDCRQGRYERLQCAHEAAEPDQAHCL